MPALDHIAGLLSQAEKVLLLGVGGGNDSITVLLLLEQLRAGDGMRSMRVDVAAMLPDFLDYRGYVETGLSQVWEMTPQTQRFAQGVRVAGFPEPLLAGNSTRFGITSVWGLDMSAGTEGIADALSALVTHQGYDLVLACDVGGDFIAAAENYDVLSPMMDAYALYSLRRLQASHPTVPLIGAVFGLGTDGESSPAMLHRALHNLGHFVEGTFAPDIAPDVEAFYRNDVEPKRYSRTADFTLQEIRGVPTHKGTESYRVRYHARPTLRQRHSYTGDFEHTLDPDFYGKYYLFDDFSGITHPFAVSGTSAVDWLLAITTGEASLERVHHEMVGQRILSHGAEILCSVPSRKFSAEQYKAIFADTVASVRNGVYAGVFVYTADVLGNECRELKDLAVVTANAHVSLIHRPDDNSIASAVTTHESRHHRA